MRWVKQATAGQKRGKMKTRIEEMLSHLALAFGGHSQYAWSDVGRAIAGQINNNGWGCSGVRMDDLPDLIDHRIEELAGYAVEILDERWNDWSGWDADQVRKDIESAARESLRQVGYGVPAARACGPV